MKPLAQLLAALAEPPELPAREWFSMRDLAVLTGRSVDTVRGWRARGLPARPYGHRGWFYVSREDLAAWMAQHPEALSPREQRLRKLAALCAPKPWPTDLRAQTRLLRRLLRDHQRWAALAEKGLRELGVRP